MWAWSTGGPPRRESSPGAVVSAVQVFIAEKDGVLAATIKSRVAFTIGRRLSMPHVRVDVEVRKVPAPFVVVQIVRGDDYSSAQLARELAAEVTEYVRAALGQSAGDSISVGPA